MATVLFGISGSIAAFRALEIIRLLVSDGIEVIPVLSTGGQQFVTKASVEALSGHRAITEIFPKDLQQEIEHISLARKADLLITCPASADIIAKYAAGIADDPLALVALTFGIPHLIAPAMNSRMWENPATEANVKILKDRGCIFIGPEKGMMACGEEGWGRLADISEIYGQIKKELGKKNILAGKRIVITAGATREAVDSVRFISNRSSGKMGHALAAAARNHGADVLLITSSQLDVPGAVSVVRVESSSQMRDAVIDSAEEADIVIMAAAVADYCPVDAVEGKIKKVDGIDAIRLQPAPDILKELGAMKRKGQIIVGFAAEYGTGGKDEALRKCRAKGCDMICLNDISREDIGFGSDYNEIICIHNSGVEQVIPKSDKQTIAEKIIVEIETLLKKDG